MAASSLEVAHIVRARGEAYRRRHGRRLPRRHLRVLRAVELCRTAALGGHRYRCDECGHERLAYNAYSSESDHLFRLKAISGPVGA